MIFWKRYLRKQSGQRKTSDISRTYTHTHTQYSILTAKVEIDRGSHFAHAILRSHLVQASVRFHHIVQIQNHGELVVAHRLTPDRCPAIGHQQHIAAIPFDVRLRCSQQLTLEDQPIAIVLLAQLRLLREAGCKIVSHSHRGTHWRIDNWTGDIRRQFSFPYILYIYKYIFRGFRTLRSAIRVITRVVAELGENVNLKQKPYTHSSLSSRRRFRFRDAMRGFPLDRWNFRFFFVWFISLLYQLIITADGLDRSRRTSIRW